VPDKALLNKLMAGGSSLQYDQIQKHLKDHPGLFKKVAQLFAKQQWLGLAFSIVFLSLLPPAINILLTRQRLKRDGHTTEHPPRQSVQSNTQNSFTVQPARPAALSPKAFSQGQTHPGPPAFSVTPANPAVTFNQYRGPYPPDNHPKNGMPTDFFQNPWTLRQTQLDNNPQFQQVQQVI